MCCRLLPTLVSWKFLGSVLGGKRRLTAFVNVFLYTEIPLFFLAPSLLDVILLIFQGSVSSVKLIFFLLSVVNSSVCKYLGW